MPSYQLCLSGGRESCATIVYIKKWMEFVSVCIVILIGMNCNNLMRLIAKLMRCGGLAAAAVLEET